MLLYFFNSNFFLQDASPILVLFLHPSFAAIKQKLSISFRDQIMTLFLGGAPTSIYHFFHSSVVHHISGTIHHVIIIFVRLVNDDISRNFFIFPKLWFFGLLCDERQKNDLKLPISVCHVVYFRNWRWYHWDFWYTDVK